MATAMRSMRAVWLAIGCLLPLATSAAAHPGARPGEAFTFKLSVGPIESGRARMSVGLPVVHKRNSGNRAPAGLSGRDGQRLVAVHAQAETAKWLRLLVRLDDDYRLVYDAGTLLPVEVESIERGVRNRRIVSKLEGRRADLEVEAKRDGGRARRLLPNVVRDPLSALFALRASPLVDGQRLGLDVLDGAALWRVKLEVHRGQRVRLEHDGDGAPAHAAIRVDGELRRIDDLGRETGGAPRHLQVWISDDDDRLLLVLEGDTDLGRASLELTGYTPASAKWREGAPPSLPGFGPVP